MKATGHRARKYGSRERIDKLIDALVLIIARRQMKGYWAARTDS